MSELYQLPDGWEWKKLSKVLDVQNGYAFDSKLFNEESGTQLIRIRDLKNGIRTEVKFSGDYDNKFLVYKGDFLIGMDGDFVCYKWKGEPSLLNQRVCRLINFSDDLEAKYVFYGINKYLDDIHKVTAYVTVKHISSKQIKDIDFPLPPLSEQQRIVSKLDLLFEKIDKSIALHQKNIDEADVFMGSVLNDVFGELEEKYEYTKMKDIVTKEKTSIKRGPFGSALKKSFFVESGYLVYEQYHALNNDFSMERYFIDDKKFNELKGFEVKAGDIIISCSGVYLGKLAIIPNDYTKGIINQALLKLTLDKDIIIDKIFVYFWNNLINNGFFNEVKKGAAIPNMPSVKQLKEIDIPLPSLNIQQKVVNYLDEVTEKIEKLKSVQKEKMDSLKALKASILDKAFRGEL